MNPTYLLLVVLTQTKSDRAPTCDTAAVAKTARRLCRCVAEADLATLRSMFPDFQKDRGTRQVIVDMQGVRRIAEVCPELRPKVVEPLAKACEEQLDASKVRCRSKTIAVIDGEGGIEFARTWGEWRARPSTGAAHARVAGELSDREYDAWLAERAQAWSAVASDLARTIAKCSWFNAKAPETWLETSIASRRQ